MTRLSTPEGRLALADEYRVALLDDTIPFWLRHAIDREHGGFLIMLDRDGSVLDDDKGMWQQCRFTWMLSRLYRTVEWRSEWGEAARHGIDFILEHGFDDDGRMFFHVTRDGRPLRKRRYLFGECFGVMALAEAAAAFDDEVLADRARSLFDLILDHIENPELLGLPKAWPGTRPTRSIGLPMILMNVGHVLNDTITHPRAAEQIDLAVEEIREYFVKPDRQVVMETVAEDGSIIDHFDGRILNPGHAIEAGWFILEEARRRGDDLDLVDLGSSMVSWMLARGWDEEYGGLSYFRDLDGKPVQEYWHDMKFWWPHNEAIIATLLAYEATGDPEFADWHEKVHLWAHEHFGDPEHGEWFGYLHRDGRRSVDLKGNLWKGPFHLPRMQLTAWRILERMADAPT